MRPTVPVTAALRYRRWEIASEHRYLRAESNKTVHAAGCVAQCYSQHVGWNVRHRLTQLLDRPIAYHRALVPLVGSVAGAVMLSQAIYWQGRTKEADGWWWHTQEDWAEETGLGRHEQDTVRRELRRRSWWEEDRRGVPARMHYRLNLDALYADLISSLPESGKLDCQETANLSAGLRSSSLPDSGKLITGTETTTEITTTTTTTPVVVGAGLEWPTLPPEQRKFAGGILAVCPAELQQPVLDEWAAAIKDGKIKRSSPLPYLRTLVTRAVEGSFTPDAGVAVSARRKNGGGDDAHQKRLAASKLAFERQMSATGTGKEAP